MIVRTLGSITHLGVLEAAGSYTRVAELTLPNGLAGTYFVRIDTAGPFEFVYGNNNSRVAGPLQIELSASPDLQVTNIVAPVLANEGDLIDITWTVANTGAATATGAWTDNVLLRRVGQPNDPGIYLGSFTYDAGGLEAGKSYTRTERFRLPAKIEGVYQTVVTTNSGGTVFEYGTAAANNSLADDQMLQVALLARPDVQVANVMSPARVSAGATASLSFTVINQGTVPTNTPHWRDNVYLSLDNKLTGDDLLLGSYDNGAALAPGEQYLTVADNDGHPISVVVPIRFRGDVFLLVQADGSGSLDEYPNDGNNIAAVPLFVEPYPLSDLVTSNVVAPVQGVEGAQLEVRYTVANKGSGTTAGAGWTDTLWISRDKTRPNAGGNSAVLIGTVQHSGALAVGESYDVTTRVTLPAQLGSGTYYITAWSDSYDVILEDTLASNLNPDDPHELDNNNYKARAIDILGFEAPLADLRVTAVMPQAQAVSAAQFSVTWSVGNFGLAEANGGWRDDVYLSDQPTLDTSGARNWFLGSFTHAAALAPGVSYQQTEVFDFSPATAGKYVIVVTDPLPPYPRGVVVESREDNNTGAGQTLVTTAPSDLRVVSVSAPLENFSGEKTTLEWSVQNVGGAVWDGTRYWIDAVWLSPDPVFNPQRATLLGTYAHSNATPLGANQTYAQSAEVTLPRGIGGKYFLYVIADANPYYPHLPNGESDRGNNDYVRDQHYTGSAYEGVGGELNNQLRGNLPVTYREPDLKITTLAVPPDGGQAGQYVTAQFTVSNIGTRDTRETMWWDRLFLSRDPSLDTGDLQLSEAQHLGILQQGGSYTGSFSFKLPEDISGDFYLLSFTDSEADVRLAYGYSNIVPERLGVGISANYDSVPEFRDEGNNITGVPFNVRPSLLPDLQVTQVVAPTHVRVGDSVEVSYTVTNAGGLAVPPEQQQWEEYIYLSRDGLLDLNSDRYMLRRNHVGGLGVGESYTVSETLRAPLDVEGAYYFFVVVDPARGSARGKVFEGAAERNNATASAPPTLFELPPPADLQVDTIAFDGSAEAGDPISVQWTVSNHSDNQTSPAWTDSVYLSEDEKWDITDRLIGKKTHTGVLNKDGGYAAELTAVLPPTTPGQYRVIVRPDIFNEVFEGGYRSPGEANNYSTSPDALTVTVDELHLGVVQDTALSTGQSRVYKLTVGEGETLRVRLTTPSQDAANEIFLRYGAVPDGFNYDASYQNPLQADQTAVIAATKPGDYYVLIRGHSEPGDNTPVKLLAEVVPFAISSVHVDQGGDSRWVTIDVRGAKFGHGDTPAENAILKLVRPDIAEFEPVTYEVFDSTWIRATFDFRAAPRGLYDVKVINPNGDEAIEPYRFLVERALEPDVTIGLGGPRVLAAGETGVYGVSLQSLTNVDTPYVKFEFGVPEMGSNEYVYGLEFLNYYNNLRGAPDATLQDLPWASLDSAVNTTGQILSKGYAYDVIAGGYVGSTFNVQTYPLLKAFATKNWDAVRVGLYEAFPALDKAQALAGGPESMDASKAAFPYLEAYWELWQQANNPDPEEGGVPEKCVIPFIPFRFNIVGAATAMTRDEFIAQQRDEALAIRTRILDDADLLAQINDPGTDATTLSLKRAALSLRTLAADAGTWSDAYIAALEQAEIIRPVDQAPPIRMDIEVQSLMSTLATGVLVGPAGDQIVTNGDLVQFFDKVATWYGSDPTHLATVDHYEPRESDCQEGEIPVPALPAFADYDQQLSHPTYFETFNIFVPYVGFDQPGASAATVALPDFASVDATNELTMLDFSRFFQQSIQSGQLASISGPQGFGPQQFLPVDQALPYTVKFENPASATSAVAEVRVLSQIDPSLDPLSFRLGDVKLGDITVHIPSDRALFQGDFDFRNAKGYILRVSAGIDPKSSTASWVFQAIDPETGEVMQDATRGLLPPNNAAGAGVGELGYSIRAKTELASGTSISAQARVLFNTLAPQETQVLVQTLDTQAPVTALTATRLQAGGGDYDVRWEVADEAQGSGLRHTTVYVSTDRGDFKIWQRQTTATSAVYQGQAGHDYEFLALSTDNAGNQENAPAALMVPDDGSGVNLGGLPSFGETSQDIAPPPAPSGPSTNPLFTQALLDIPVADPLSRLPEFDEVLRPFSAQSFATDFVQSHANIGPMAILELPDGDVIASGGPNRGWLYRFDAFGGRALQPFLELDDPIFDLAFDADGQLWATTGGNALIQIDLATGTVLGRYGESITQAIALNKATGELYVSSGSGVEIFDPVLHTFRHFSDNRVDDLAFNPADGSLWGSLWPDRGDVVKFDLRGRVQSQVRLDSEVDSLAFGLPGTQLAGLLFVSNNETPGRTGSALVMVDLATLNSVAVARGGSRGEALLALQDGRLLVGQSHQIDVFAPVVAPKVVTTSPVDGAVAPLPMSRVGVVFDHDMFQGAANEPGSVLNPGNFALIGSAGQPILIRSVSYDTASRTAVLSFDQLEADEYTLRVSSSLQSDQGMRLDDAYETGFTALLDFSNRVAIGFVATRSDRASGTVSYDVTVTNIGDDDLRAPLTLVIDPGQYFSGHPIGAQPSGQGLWLIDLSSALSGGALKTGEQIAAQTVTVTTPGNQRADLGHGVYALPYPNDPPVFTSRPVTLGQVGATYSYQAQGADPDGHILGYVLLQAPEGMVVDPVTGLVSWTPALASPEQASVVLRVYDRRGGFAEQAFAIDVTGTNLPPQIAGLPAGFALREGELFSLLVSADDPERQHIVYYADNLPPGAVFDPDSQTLQWLPGYDAAGVYPDVSVVASDGLNRTVASFTLTVEQGNQTPTLRNIPDRVVREGDPLQLALVADDAEGGTLVYSIEMAPPGSWLDPNTGVFTWIPAFNDADDYELAFKVDDGNSASTMVMQLTVLNVNAAPVFDALGSWISYEGQPLSFRAFALDPDNPGFEPQDRLTNGQLTPLEGSLPSVTYTVTDLPDGAVFDAETAQFNWTPDFTQAGEFTVRFTATDDGDGVGAPVSSVIDVPISIRNANRAPVVPFIDTQQVQKDGLLELPVAVTDPDGDPLTLTVTGLPAFASFTDNGDGTGRFRFAPLTGDRGDYEIALTASDGHDGGLTVARTQSQVTYSFESPSEDPANPVWPFVVTAGNTLAAVVATATANDGSTFSPTDGASMLALPAGDPETSIKATFKDVVPGSEFSLDLAYLGFDSVNNDFLSVTINDVETVLNARDFGAGLGTMGWTTMVSVATSDTVTVVIKSVNGGGSTNGDSVLLLDNVRVLHAEPVSHVRRFILQAQSPAEPPRLAPIGDKVALVGHTLSFLIQANDLDQDALTFGVEATGGPLPAGLTVTPQVGYGRALVEWTPTAAELNQSFDVRVRVTDNGNGGVGAVGTDAQDVRIVVRDSNVAPVLSPVGNQTVQEGQALQITLSAFDADNDRLTYAVTNLPAGASFDMVNGVMRWTPTVFSAGEYPGITFTVSDGSAQSSETITVTVGNVNQAPVLVPLFPQLGRENALVQFTLSVGDVDGDAIVFSALSALPAGSRFDSRSGAFSWTPGYTQAGDYTLRFAALDPASAQSEITVLLSIADVNRAPTLEVSNHAVQLGDTLEFSVHGADPDPAAVLAYSARGLPEGATLDPATGVFRWTPSAGQIGEYLVMASVSDGLMDVSEPLRIRAALTPVPPQVVIELTPSFPVVSGQEVLLHAVADSFSAIVGLTLSFDGVPVTLDELGRGRVVATDLGKHTVTATAVDADGLVGTASTVIRVKDASDKQAPVISLDPAVFGARLTAATDIGGSVSDVNLDQWRLEIARQGGDAFSVLAQGDVPVAPGALTRLDPATLANGFYRLRLTAIDYAGRISEVETGIEISTADKSGQYQRSDVDFSAGLGGHVLAFTRHYDSFTRDIAGSFGQGWSFQLRDVDLQTDVDATGSEEFGTYNPFRAGTRVVLTLPDGRRVAYTLDTTEHRVAGLTYHTPTFTPDAGVDWQLGLDAIKLIRAGNRLYDLDSSRPYNPTSSEFGEAPFVLTAPDGTVYRIGASQGVREIVYSDGVRLAVTDSGIFAPDGASIRTVTDGQGRIAQVIAPNGNTYVYLYDNGNLTGVRRLAEETSANYGYALDDAHLLGVVGGAGGGVVAYGAQPSLQALTADLGGALEYLHQPYDGTLAAGASDHLGFVVRPSEITSSAGAALYLSVVVEGADAQPQIPQIAGLAPVVTRTEAGRATRCSASRRPGCKCWK